MSDEKFELEGTPLNSSRDDEVFSASEEKPSTEEVQPAEEITEEQVAAVEEKPSDEQAQVSAENTMDQLDFSGALQDLSKGALVSGVVVHIDKEGVLVDVGTKSEGIIRLGELATHYVQDAEDVVSVGEKIDVYVIQTENEDGNPVLSKKRADFEKAWVRVQAAHEDGKTLNAMVSDRVKGGLVVDLGIRGFVPGSHVGNGKVKNLERYIGQSIPLKVIEVDRERRKVVLSHRLAIEEERGKQRDDTIETLKEGEIRDGVVRRITDYGAFVDLGGIDGLLHVSEMSWTRINHPSEVVKVGQKIQVMILKLNLEAGRISLGLRQILPDPWMEIIGKYRVGETVKGSVSRLVPFGAFVQLEHGVEAIIPNNELADRRVKRPEDVVNVGEDIEAKIIDIRTDERRMTLSMRQQREEGSRKEYEVYKSSGGEMKTTLGDLLGDSLGGLKGVEVKEEEEPETEQEETVETPEEAVEEIVAEEPETEQEEASEADEPQAEEAVVEEKPVEEEEAEKDESETVNDESDDVAAEKE